MSDLISRQKVLDQIEKAINEPEFMHDGDDFYAGLYRALTIVEYTPSAQQWIPVSERLPEKTGVYIVHFRDGEEEDHVFVWWLNEGTYSGCTPTYIDGDKYWASAFNGEPINEYMSKRVVAWMPLPEPYKEEEA